MIYLIWPEGKIGTLVLLFGLAREHFVCSAEHNANWLFEGNWCYSALFYTITVCSLRGRRTRDESHSQLPTVYQTHQSDLSSKLRSDPRFHQYDSLILWTTQQYTYGSFISSKETQFASQSKKFCDKQKTEKEQAVEHSKDPVQCKRNKIQPLRWDQRTTTFHHPRLKRRSLLKNRSTGEAKNYPPVMWNQREYPQSHSGHRMTTCTTKITKRESDPADLRVCDKTTNQQGL